MTEAATRIDEGKQRLQAAADPPPVTRTKDPSYTVFVFTGEENGLRLIRQGVKAANRKEAIRAVSEESGKYLAIPDKEYQPMTRSIRQTTVDEFE